MRDAGSWQWVIIPPPFSPPLHHSLPSKAQLCSAPTGRPTRKAERESLVGVDWEIAVQCLPRLKWYECGVVFERWDEAGAGSKEVNCGGAPAANVPKAPLFP
eukprot:Sspe_Gene.19965::Locus_7301_Transcript_1_2_Confidence_0.500_Length_2561::g.19965::m.19965